MKLVLPEVGSDALKTELDQWDERVSCGISQTEVMRAVRQAAADAPTREAAAELVRHAESVLLRIPMLDADSNLLKQAALVDPLGLRSLDAIHLSAAISLGDDLGGFFTYDRRLADAARQHGLEVLSPA